MECQCYCGCRETANQLLTNGTHICSECFDEHASECLSLECEAIIAGKFGYCVKCHTSGPPVNKQAGGVA